jgi:glycosyltransferase involved in cell wall biosynthesis
VCWQGPVQYSRQPRTSHFHRELHLKLSVILPCYNGADTIAVQLQALTSQAWDGGWEVIVVNNGSTDGSMKIVELYRDRLPDLAIVEAYVPGRARLGVPHSYNTGIAAATGDAFVFCEADDEVAPGWLAAMGRALTDHEFVVGRLDHRKLNANWLHPPYGDGYQAQGLFKLPCYPYFYSASACAFGLRRSLYISLGPLSIDFPIVHDAEYCWRAQAAGYALHFEPEALVYYREKSSLVARFKQGRNWAKDSTRLYAHYGPPPARLAALRQISAMARSLPGGLKTLIPYALKTFKGRNQMADWVWNFGWSTGMLLGTLQAQAELRSGARAGAHSLRTSGERPGLPSEFH